VLIENVLTYLVDNLKCWKYWNLTLIISSVRVDV